MGERVLFANQARAVFSDCGRYRYALWREWNPKPIRRCLFVMLNPSTATSEKDDPTIRRCIKFAQRWGFDALDVANLFAFRTSYPSHLWESSKTVDIVGVQNDDWIQKLADRCDRIVVAWGNHKDTDREDRVLDLLGERELVCLGLTEQGQPTHPLARGHHWIPDDAEPIEYLGDLTQVPDLGAR